MRVSPLIYIITNVYHDYHCWNMYSLTSSFNIACSAMNEEGGTEKAIKGHCIDEVKCVMNAEVVYNEKLCNYRNSEEPKAVRVKRDLRATILQRLE